MSIGTHVLTRAWNQLRRFTERRRVRLAGRVTAVIAVGLVGGWIGLLAGGHAQTDVGPADVHFTLHPSATGGTVIDIPPLGTLRLDSHVGPVRIDAQVIRLRPDRARELIENPSAFDRLSDTIGGDVRHAFIEMAAKGAAAALACAALAGALVFRNWRRTLWTTVSALNGLIIVGLLGSLTFNPESIAEPRFTGILASAPQVVGDAKTLVSRIGAYREQLARLVGNMSRLYDVTSTLPTYEPDPTTIRVLHVSDIHLNPVAWNVIRQVVNQFHIQVVIDTGDLTDHGTKAEDKFANSISKFKVPYVFIRGNHDSTSIEKAVRRQKNAVVLDDQVADVGGLRIFGTPDPRFTPDKTTRGDQVGAQEMLAYGRTAVQRLRTLGKNPDIVLTHDPNEGQAFDGTAPLILAGHTHQRSTRLLQTGTRLFIQGSTGGAGLRGLEHEQPTPIEMSVLYFNRASHRLQGWDDIRLGGLGLTSAQIERTLESKPDRPISPPPAQTPSGTPLTPTPSTAAPRPSAAGRPR
ncbi:metallophosphoesterase [Actinoallomurus purpureus]|uniref:metallophosphoesterase family protein n=1 Tax=Actinoallomurus purpureus TaxID=478114 RepID=UPI00209230EC|nr:metallophosphoesterase [Actinoallomurus purpureus]MCO6009120.1 metallophosphoesterase [Actinoallomurus purpureus]